MQNTRATPYKWDKTNSCMCVKLLKCRQKCILMRTRANALRVVYPFGSPLIPLNLPTKTGKFYTLNVCTIVHNFSIIYCLFYFKVVFRMKSEYFYCFILPLLFVDNFHMYFMSNDLIACWKLSFINYFQSNLLKTEFYQLFSIQICDLICTIININSFSERFEI